MRLKIYSKILQAKTHLIIDPEYISDVNPNVNGVDKVWEGKVKFVIILRKAEMLVGYLPFIIMDTDKVITRPAEHSLEVLLTRFVQ